MKTYTANEVRRAEQPLLAAGVPLMARASAALADETRHLLATAGIAVERARVLVLAGSGNNGGDALFAAAQLAGDGATVNIAKTSERIHAEGLAAAMAAGATLLGAAEPGTTAPDAAARGASAPEPAPALPPDASAPDASAPALPPDASAPDTSEPDTSEPDTSEPAPDASEPDTSERDTSAPAPAPDLPPDASGAELASVRAAVRTCDVVLDGILGTGTSADPSLRGRARDVVAAALEVFETGRPLVVAVDLPSGIGADDGAVPDPTVLPATITVTFGGCKRGLLLEPGAGYAGRVIVAEIGLGPQLARIARER